MAYVRYNLDNSFSSNIFNELNFKKMTTTKTNTILWIALIILISLSYFFAESGFKNAALLISVASIIKFLSVGFQFMEAKIANKTWQYLLMFFALVYFTAIFVFY